MNEWEERSKKTNQTNRNLAQEQATISKIKCLI